MARNAKKRKIKRRNKKQQPIDFMKKRQNISSEKEDWLEKLSRNLSTLNLKEQARESTDHRHSTPAGKFTSPLRSLASSRLSTTNEIFEYETITVTETHEEYKLRQRLLQGGMTTQQSDGPQGNPLLSKDNKFGLLKRRCKLDSTEEQMTSSRYCGRAISMNDNRIPKHFCDILGPVMCKDCMERREKQASLEESLGIFPEIRVSPYMLCVPTDSRESSSAMVYKSCDTIQRNRSSLSSPFKNEQFPCKTRANSVTENESMSRNSTSLSFYIPTARNCTDPPSFQSTDRSPIFHRTNSQRSSIVRFQQTRGAAKRALSEGEIKQNGQTLEDFEERPKTCLPANVFSKAIKARKDFDRQNRVKSSVIERRGKLMELPYWKFLIPEPPKLEVDKMNVSIFTPKDIPGIKIFDESFFDI